jgi:hypothetical protein
MLFSPAMIRAILAGRKTQTRRLMRDQTALRMMDGPEIWTGFMGWQAVDDALADRGACGKGVLPRVATGDRIYCREAWRTWSSYDQRSPRDLPELKNSVSYEASPNEDRSFGPTPSEVGKFRQAMHMPRWASRLTLLVNKVRIERLRDISEEDAIAEGIELSDPAVPAFGWRCYLPEPKQQDAWGDPRLSYRTLWSSINGSDINANPWVVAYTFRVVLQNIDQIEKAAA